MDISNIYSARDNMDYLVSLMMQQEMRPKWAIEDKQQVYNLKKSTLTKLDSNLSSLYSKINDINDSVFDFFAVKNATSSDTDNFTVSAGTNAQAGNHSLSVTRLATSDRRASEQFTDGNFDFTGVAKHSVAALTEMDHLFTLTGATTDVDGDPATYDLNITIDSAWFDGTNTDSEILAEIETQINDTMATVKSGNEYIENDEVITASIVTESSGVSRLVLNSGKTGTDNAIVASDTTGQLLNYLGVLDGSGDYDSASHDYGLMTSLADLDSSFVLDGLSFTRDSNSVTDAISGLTINLLNLTEVEQTITIDTDTETVKSDIQAFMDDFNSSIDFLKENARMNPDTRVRGALSNDSTYSGLRSQLLGVVLNQVTSDDDFDRMADIGIGMDSNGKLSFIDSDKFTSALETDTNIVANIFNNSSDGIATMLEETINNFTKTGGIIDSSKSQIDDTIVRLDTSLKRVDNQLLAKENRIRSDLARMQESMARLNNQSSYLSIFSSSF
jgi:flagellar hook-associated protein 2